MATAWINGLLIIVLMFVAVGMLIRGVFGQHVYAAYNQGLWKVVKLAWKQFANFLKWTWARHRQFWLGVAVATIIATIFSQ